MWIAMKRLLIIFPLFIMALSCSLDDNEMVEPEELGVKESSVTVACTAGTHDLEILSDGEFTLSLPSDAPWLSLEKGRSIKGSGDSSVKLVHEMNRGPERTAVILLRKERPPKLLKIRCPLRGNFYPACVKLKCQRKDARATVCLLSWKGPHCIT